VENLSETGKFKLAVKYPLASCLYFSMTCALILLLAYTLGLPESTPPSTPEPQPTAEVNNKSTFDKSDTIEKLKHFELHCQRLLARQVFDELEQNFDNWQSGVVALKNGTRYRKLLSDEAETERVQHLLSQYPADENAKKTILELCNEAKAHFSTGEVTEAALAAIAEVKRKSLEYQNRLSELAKAETRYANRMEIFLNLQEAIDHYHALNEEKFLTSVQKQKEQLLKTHNSSVATVKDQQHRVTQEIEAVKLKIAKAKTKHDNSVAASAELIKNAQLNRKQRHQRAQAKFEREVLPHLALLKPFTSAGYRQPGTNLALRDDIDKKPMSYSELSNRGMLETSKGSVRLFFGTASSRRLNNNNDRPLGIFPRRDTGKNTPYQLEQVKLAQKLIREHGPMMVEKGLLSE